MIACGEPPQVTTLASTPACGGYTIAGVEWDAPSRWGGGNLYYLNGNFDDEGRPIVGAIAAIPGAGGGPLALDPATGAHARFFDHGDDGAKSAVVIGGRLYFSGDDAQGVRRLDEGWASPSPYRASAIGAESLATDGTLLFTNDDVARGVVHAHRVVEADGGAFELEPVWQVDLGGRVRGLGFYDRGGAPALYASPGAAGDDRRIAAIDTRTGALVWMVDREGTPIVVPGSEPIYQVVAGRGPSGEPILGVTTSSRLYVYRLTGVATVCGAPTIFTTTTPAAGEVALAADGLALRSGLYGLGIRDGVLYLVHGDRIARVRLSCSDAGCGTIPGDAGVEDAGAPCTTIDAALERRAAFLTWRSFVETRRFAASGPVASELGVSEWETHAARIGTSISYYGTTGYDASGQPVFVADLAFDEAHGLDLFEVSPSDSIDTLTHAFDAYAPLLQAATPSCRPLSDAFALARRVESEIAEAREAAPVETSRLPSLAPVAFTAARGETGVITWIDQRFQNPGGGGGTERGCTQFAHQHHAAFLSQLESAVGACSALITKDALAVGANVAPCALAIRNFPDALRPQLLKWLCCRGIAPVGPTGVPDEYYTGEDVSLATCTCAGQTGIPEARMRSSGHPDRPSCVYCPVSTAPVGGALAPTAPAGGLECGCPTGYRFEAVEHGRDQPIAARCVCESDSCPAVIHVIDNQYVSAPGLTLTAPVLDDDRLDGNMAGPRLLEIDPASITVSSAHVTAHTGSTHEFGNAHLRVNVAANAPAGSVHYVDFDVRARNREGRTATVTAHSRAKITVRCTANEQCDDGNHCTDDLCSEGLCNNRVIPPSLCSYELRPTDDYYSVALGQSRVLEVLLNDVDWATANAAVPDYSVISDLEITDMLCLSDCPGTLDIVPSARIRTAGNAAVPRTAIRYTAPSALTDAATVVLRYTVAAPRVQGLPRVGTARATIEVAPAVMTAVDDGPIHMSPGATQRVEVLLNDRLEPGTPRGLQIVSVSDPALATIVESYLLDASTRLPGGALRVRAPETPGTYTVQYSVARRGSRRPDPETRAATLTIVVEGCLLDAQCDDRDVCNGTERCVEGRCQTSGTQFSCADGPCTIGFCSPATGCGFVTDPSCQSPCPGGSCQCVGAGCGCSGPYCGCTGTNCVCTGEDCSCGLLGCSCAGPDCGGCSGEGCACTGIDCQCTGADCRPGYVCVPRTCGAGQCGQVDDGCGGTLDCGSCDVCQFWAVTSWGISSCNYQGAWRFCYENGGSGTTSRPDYYSHTDCICDDPSGCNVWFTYTRSVLRSTLDSGAQCAPAAQREPEDTPGRWSDGTGCWYQDHHTEYQAMGCGLCRDFPQDPPLPPEDERKAFPECQDRREDGTCASMGIGVR